jgi:hypothetical protein
MLKEAAAIGMLSAVLPSFIVYNADEEGKKGHFQFKIFYCYIIYKADKIVTKGHLS